MVGWVFFKQDREIFALIAKLDWKLLSEDHSPWAQVLKAKYLSSNTNRIIGTHGHLKALAPAHGQREKQQSPF